MRVLVYRYNSIYEPDVLDSLKFYGLDVDEETREMSEKKIESGERIQIVADRILKSMEEKRPYIFVFSINFYPDLSAVCEKFGVLYVCWSVDCPVLELFSKEICNAHNRVFLFDKKQYERFWPHNNNGIFHLPLASNVERMQNTINTITEADRKKYSSDITFIGSLYSEKNDYKKLKGLSDYTKGFVDALVNAQLGVYGYNFIEEALTDDVVVNMKNGPLEFDETALVEGIDRFTAAHQYIGYEIAERERQTTLEALSERFQVDLYTLSDTSKLPKVHVKGRANSFTEMPKIFNLSKINLNMTMRPIQAGIPLRVFDILACGGFCITNYQEELPELFEIGVDIEAYTSLDELIDKCEYYLTHEEERKKIALNGLEKSRMYHNTRNRMADIIRAISG